MVSFTDEDDELLSSLGVEVQKKRVAKLTPRQERIIAGFEEVQRFVEGNGRNPQQGEGGDIFERLYAVRLEQIRDQVECRDLVAGLDYQGLLEGNATVEHQTEAGDLDDDALLAELGVEAIAPDITELKHVRSSEERKAAEEIANRERCPDFEIFEPLFDEVQKDLDAGLRETRPFELKAEIQKGRFFIVSGQKAYVADMGETFTTDHGRSDARLRIIFDNGTESNMLMRSLQRALNKDEAGRRITDTVAGPLFTRETEDGDEASGTIYVLRSKADHPLVEKNRELVHKIGVTTLPVEKRIAGARLQPTFLMADVTVVATYELYNINRSKLEHLIHRIFEPCRLNIEIKDRFGKPVMPREWFLVPLFVVDEAVERIRDGSISNFVYDPDAAALVKQVS